MLLAVVKYNHLQDCNKIYLDNNCVLCKDLVAKNNEYCFRTELLEQAIS